MKIWTDGSGNGRYAFVTEDNQQKISEGGNTNNQAEYLAVLSALKFAQKNQKKKIEILSDSKLVVNQLKRDWHIKEDRLRKLATRIWNLISENDLEVKFTWVPREENMAGKLLG